MVAEGAAGRLEVVDFFGDRIAGEVDTVVAEPFGARPVRRGDGAVGLLAEEVRQCSIAELTSGQSSRTEPSTPR